MIIYYVYFVLQKDFNFTPARNSLKVGHSKNPKQRNYSYNDLLNTAKIIHSIPCDSKQLALEIERGYVRLLKYNCNKSSIYADSREWFQLDEKIINVLNLWEIKHEVFV